MPHALPLTRLGSPETALLGGMFEGELMATRLGARPAGRTERGIVKAWEPALPVAQGVEREGHRE